MMMNKKRLWSIISSVLLVLCFALVLLKLFFLDSRMVTSGSMDDTLKHGDYILSWKLRFAPDRLASGRQLNTGLKRGAIVLFKPAGERDVLIKRIIGLPGDAVEIQATGVLINGKQLHEKYAKQQAVTTGSRVYSVPANKFFVLGDNRPVSRDSREFGMVSTADVLGKVVLVYYPFHRIRLFF